MVGDPVDTGFMLLASAHSRIEGPQHEIMRILFHSLVRSLMGKGMSETDADALAYRMIARVQVRLADHGYVVRDFDPDPPAA
jgi:hypothetical protein